jgi:hypothetical protein
MKHTLAFFALMLLAHPETVQAPHSIPHERGSIVVSAVQGGERWTADWTMEPFQENGRPAVRFTERGRGKYSSYNQPIAWRIESIWTADGSFHPLRIEKTVTDMSGHVVGTEKKTFQPGKASGLFDRTREGRADETKRLAAPDDTLAPEGIAGILQFLPFDQWRPQTVHLFTNEPKVYQMKIEMRGKERVKTPGGEYDTYKIELVPELGAMNLIRGLLPKAYFWFTQSAPHFWVKYEGPENGPGTPHIVMELKSYEPK